ncbi:MAG: hypothetical protein ACLT3H_14165 [Roseburia sp.]
MLTEKDRVLWTVQRKRCGYLNQKEDFGCKLFGRTTTQETAGKSRIGIFQQSSFAGRRP